MAQSGLPFLSNYSLRAGSLVRVRGKFLAAEPLSREENGPRKCEPARKLFMFGKNLTPAKSVTRSGISGYLPWRFTSPIM